MCEDYQRVYHLTFATVNWVVYDNSGNTAEGEQSGSEETRSFCML